VARGLKVRPLRRGERDAALELLAADPLRNLILVDAVQRLGLTPVPGEMRTRVLGAWADGELVALASQQPAMCLSASAAADAAEALLPHLCNLSAGLIKTAEAEAALLWEPLRRGRRALLDRFELAFAVTPAEARLIDLPPGTGARCATSGDLEALVEAARASLREEDRPDPFEGDVEGFRRWVAGRVGRATLLERAGVPCFVGYADVCTRQGWLLQGVYTWPEFRRRGFGAAGVSELCRRAFAEGAGHVQLAVVEGNAAAKRLYASLGFRPFERLRTILFS
jgi:RimJ/RimL family protein N-acetyltransferase